MKKNVASQKIGAQMVSASDGSAFTSAVTVAVTGDAGSQATGSVGAGACTHEGNGYHTYAPAQAETNYDLVAFTFTGSGAIPATVQVFTSFPQTGDSYPDVVNAESDIDTVASDVLLIKAVTAKIDTSVELDGAVYRFTTNALEQAPTGGSAPTAAAIADAVWDEATTGHTTSGTFGEQLKTDVDAILVDTDVIGATGAGLTSLATQASVNTIDDFLDTEVAAIKAKTDSLTFTVAGTVDANVQAVNDTTVTGAGTAGDPWGP